MNSLSPFSTDDERNNASDKNHDENDNENDDPCVLTWTTCTQYTHRHTT